MSLGKRCFFHRVWIIFEDYFPRMSGFPQIRNSLSCTLQTLSQDYRCYRVVLVRLETERLNYCRSLGSRLEGGGSESEAQALAQVWRQSSYELDLLGGEA